MMSDDNKTPTRHPIDRRYDEGYFHGQGSGYGEAGYEREHADWSRSIAWMKTRFDREPRWLDVGCAYGFLLKQAAKLGVEAVGVDISSYALQQETGPGGSKIQGLADFLPFLDNSFGIVSLFDLLEHVDNPDTVIDEVKRVLTDDGICLITTPDPLYFNRPEATHVHERPPSYWVRLFERYGFQTAIRYGTEPYDLKLIACLGKGEQVIETLREFERMDSGLAERIHIEGERILMTPRRSTLTASLCHGNSLYVLNPFTEPVRLSITFRSNQENHPNLFLGDLKLKYLECDESDGMFLHHWQGVTIPPGGRELIVRCDGDFYPIERIEIQAQRREVEQFLLELPFDHYQRYQTVACLIESMEKGPLSILDVGGALGFFNLFAVKHNVTVLDRVWEDSPHAIRYDSDRIPYGDRSFDVVICVDTLEHVSADKRGELLVELNRVARKAVFLCGPFDEPHVAEAEAIVREYLVSQFGRRDRFLDEHQLYNLPNLQETLTAFENQNGFSITAVPNGYLPRWLAMQLASLSLSMAPELSEARNQLNALYNANFFEIDNCFPAYRMVAVITRHELSDEVKIRWKQLVSFEQAEDSPTLWNVAGLIVSLANLGLIREKDGILSSKESQVDKLLDHINNLETDLKESRSYSDRLLGHTENLDALERAHRTHADNLTHLLEEDSKERHNLLTLNAELQEHNSSIQQHSTNLETQIGRLQDHNDDLQKHCDSLQQRIEELQAQNASLLEHGRNLEKRLQESELHTRNLDERYQNQSDHVDSLDAHLKNLEKSGDEWKAHATNLESSVRNLEKLLQSIQAHATNLESIINEKDKHALNLEQEFDRINMELNQVRNLVDNTCNAVFATVGKEIPEGMDKVLNQLISIVQTLTRERNRLRLEIAQYQNSRRYRVLSKLRLTPSIEEPHGE